MARADYPSRGAWRFTDVTRDFDFWPTLESISIATVHPDAVAALSCRVVDPDASLDFRVENEVVVTFRNERIWAGHLRSVSAGGLSEVGPRVWDLEGQDYTATLDDSVILGRQERPRESVTARVEWILTHLDASISFDDLDLPDEQVEPASCEGATVREALERVAEEQGLHLSVDAERVLHLSRTELLDAPFELSTSPDYATSYPYTMFRHALDSVELTNAVRVHGARHRRWVTERDSIDAYGRQESAIIDDSLKTVAQVMAAGRRQLRRLAEPIVEGALVCWEPGLRAGMRVRIVNDPWGIDGEFVLTEVHIAAVDPHDSEGEALLRSEVTFTDVRRVGRLPGSGKARQERASRGGPGTCCDPVPIDDAPLTEYGGIAWLDLDTFSRTLTSEQDFGRADNDRAEDRFWDDMQEEG